MNKSLFQLCGSRTHSCLLNGTLYFLIFILLATVVIGSAQPRNTDGQIKPSLQSDTAQIGSLIKRAFRFREEKQADSSIYYAEAALDLIGDQDLYVYRLRALRLIGSSFVLKDDYLTAYHYLKNISAKRIGDDASQLEELANALNYKAIVISYLGNYDSALYYFNESYKLHEQTGNTVEMGGKLVSIGKVNMHMGNYPIALNHFFNAFDLIGEDQMGKYILNLNIAQCYVFLKEYEKAIPFAQTARMGFEEIGSSVVGLHESYSTLGRAYSRTDKPDSSIYFLSRSISVSEEMNYQEGVAGGQYYLSLHHLRAGEWGRAYQLAETAYLHFSKTKGLRRATEALYVMAQASFGLNKTGNALKFAKEGLQLSRDLKARDTEKEFLKLLADVYGAQADYRQAYHFSNEYSRVKDIILDEEKTRQIANLEALYQNEVKERELVLARSEQKVAKARLEEQAVRELFLLAGLITIAIFLLLGAVLFHFQRKNKKIAQAQNVELQRLNRTKDRFFTIVGHDLRGPITSFTGVNTLIDWYVEHKNFKKLKELGQDIAQAAAQLDTLLNNLLGWAMTQTEGIPYAPQHVQLRVLTEEVGQLFRHLLQAKQIRFKDAIPQDTQVYADKNALMLVLRNLVSNALKFTSAGGSITISCQQDEQTLWISVKDSGVGMDSGKLEGLFELNEDKSTFGTANEKGTGLGLLLCKEYVELNKGSIRVESLVNQGTLFSFSVPVRHMELKSAS